MQSFSFSGSDSYRSIPLWGIWKSGAARVAGAALEALDDKWGQRYPAIIKLWRNAWSEFIPFLDYDVEIRR